MNDYKNTKKSLLPRAIMESLQIILDCQSKIHDEVLKLIPFHYNSSTKVEIQEAPFEGKISREKIQKAVESVSKNRSLEKCQHECDGSLHLPQYQYKCYLCGEFFR